jgi:hypothetical protein
MTNLTGGGDALNPYTCRHGRCRKHGLPRLSSAVGHTCCGQCPDGEACKQAAWGHAPITPHPYDESPLFPGVCSTCKHGPH